MRKKKNKRQPEASAPGNSIRTSARTAGNKELALTKACLQTLEGIKIAQATQQLLCGEQVPVTLVLNNDATEEQAVLECFATQGGFANFFEELHTVILEMEPSRSAVAFPLEGAKDLLHFTEEALIFWAATPDRDITFAIPVVRDEAGHFIGYGKKFDIEWTPDLLVHAFGERDSNTEFSIGTCKTKNPWGNN